MTEDRDALRELARQLFHRADGNTDGNPTATPPGGTAPPPTEDDTARAYVRHLFHTTDTH
ncbi:hypothetical protein [Georgenia muralis]